jgi:hypothetical protein
LKEEKMLGGGGAWKFAKNSEKKAARMKGHKEVLNEGINEER